MPEQRAPKRPRQKSDGVAAERSQCPRKRVEGREECFVEDQRRGGGVDQEIVPFNDRPEAACEHDGVKLRALYAQDLRRCHDGH